MNATAVAPAVAWMNVPSASVPRVDARPAGTDWKKFAIFRLDSSGRPELLSDTNLSSEADRFETLGYLVSSITANGGWHSSSGVLASPFFVANE